MLHMLYSNIDTLSIMFGYYLISKLVYNTIKIVFFYLINKIAIYIITRQILNGTIKILNPSEFDLLDSDEKGH